MAEEERRRTPHHTGDPTPPDPEPAQPNPSWGDEGGGGEYEGGPITHGEPEPPADPAEEDQRPKR